MADAIQISATSNTQTDSVVCRLCKRQFAKYTCPTCNAPYCSLTCFRSPAHNQCSETFYKKEIEADIHSGPSKTAQERQRMLDLLKKFEEEEASGQFLGEDDENEEDDDEFDLAKRFESVDLDSLAPDELWSMLTPEEKKKFLKVFDDPTSELAQQLLSSDQLEKEIKEPWWEAPSVENGGEAYPSGARQHGPRPSMMDIPASMIKPVPTGHPLVYNMSAICIAYAYTTRHLGVSPLGSLKPEDMERREARQLISHLVPFLTERKSTQVFPDLPSVITAVWSLLEPGKMTDELMALLLKDAASLLRPLRITQAMPSQEGDLVTSVHPHVMPILVLSDLKDLFSEKEAPSKPNHVTHKLLFYAAHILSTPSAILRSIADEMLIRARDEDSGIAEGYVGRAEEKRSEPKSLIEEISERPGPSRLE